MAAKTCELERAAAALPSPSSVALATFCPEAAREAMEGIEMEDTRRVSCPEASTCLGELGLADCCT